MALFESYDRRIDHINAVLNEYGINGIEDAKAICDAKGIDPYTMCKETQPICFENACWAYVVGAAIAIKKGCTNAAEAAEAIGIGLQSFCIDGSVADDRKVGSIKQLPEYRRCRDRQRKQRDLVPYRTMQHIYAALFHFHSSFHTFFTNR